MNKLESVSLEDARRMIEAGERKAREIEQPSNVAVVDAGGNLVAHIRMDGAWIGSVDISINKAFTSRAFDISTADLAENADGPMPTGVTVSHSGRIFVNFPKWGDDVMATIAEVRDGECVPFPDQASKLDTGSPGFQPTEVDGPKLVCVDRSTDTVVQIVPPREVALEATYLNDIRFDLRRGEAGTAFITDSSDGGANGSSWWTWRRGRAGGGCTIIGPPSRRARRRSAR